MSTNILKFNREIEKHYFNPILTLEYDTFSGAYLNMYCFISQNDYWSNTNLPQLTQNDYSIKNIHKNIIALKKINVTDICPVIERINWESNTYFDIYSDKIDLFERDTNGKLIRKFYIKNRYDQVFKCLWNNKNTSNTYIINDIIHVDNYKSVKHTGGTFEIGSYITIDYVLPNEFNGTYKVISSSLGMANVAYGNSGSYIFTTNNSYVSSGTIKYAQLATDEPIFDVGTFDSNQIVKTSDGYKWKYIYTIDPGLKLKFFDDNWMPVPVQITDQNYYLNYEKAGSIDVINVIDGGNNYVDGTQTVNISVIGDGDGLTGDVYVINNKIQDVYISNTGYNYTYANVNLIPDTNLSGSGVIVDFSISPIGGHGFNIMNEFDSRNVMISSFFEKSENEQLPTDISFQQIGLMYNPYTFDNIRANNTFYNTTTMITVSSGITNYNKNEIVYQGSSLLDSTFYGTVISFDIDNNILYLINTNGEPLSNYSLIGNETGTNRIILNINTPSIIPYSGNIFYVENKNIIERSSIGTEQIKILLSY